MKDLETLRALRDQGQTAEYLEGVCRLATICPRQAEVRIEAAYACDAYGAEEDAIVHYDAAWRLGVPIERTREFLIGYGSTLRNVGRFEESVVLLADAIEQFPGDPPLRAFLALALSSSGHHFAALATMLDLSMDLADAQNAFGGYQRALAEYQRQLLDREMSKG